MNAIINRVSAVVGTGLPQVHPPQVPLTWTTAEGLSPTITSSNKLGTEKHKGQQPKNNH